MATTRSVSAALVDAVEGQCSFTFGEIPTRTPGTDGRVTLTFSRDFTVAEQATLDAIIAAARSTATVSAAEWAGIEADVALRRTFRQRSQAEWMALTANQRERETFDMLNALDRIARALTRD